jgi:hypothetical protein
MVAWWKRLLFSLASMIAAAVICLALMLLATTLKSHSANIHSSEVILTVAVMIGFCLIGWVISIPAVLIVRNISGGRFWLYWILGSSVGPLLMLLLVVAVFVVVPHGPGAQWFNPAFRPLAYLAAAISSLTSLCYLLLLGWAQRRAVPSNAATTL